MPVRPMVSAGWGRERGWMDGRVGLVLYGGGGSGQFKPGRAQGRGVGAMVVG